MIKSRVKYVYWLDHKEEILELSPFTGSKVAKVRDNTKFERGKVFSGRRKMPCWRFLGNCKNWPSFAAADSGEYPWPVRFWKNSLNFAVLLSLKSKQPVVSHKMLFFGI